MIKKQTKKIIAIILVSSCLSVFCGACNKENTEITSADPEDGTYSTQTSMTTADYGVFMTKQISTFLNQIITHISIISNSDTGMYENEQSLAESSLTIMQSAYNNVVTTMPSATYEIDREGLLLAMQTAIGHMEGYIGALENKADVTQYQTDFKNDMNALTVYANLYYQ